VRLISDVTRTFGQGVWASEWVFRTTGYATAVRRQSGGACVLDPGLGLGAERSPHPAAVRHSRGLVRRATRTRVCPHLDQVDGVALELV
jgi:hypothetical protein